MGTDGSTLLKVAAWSTDANTTENTRTRFIVAEMAGRKVN